MAEEETTLATQAKDIVQAAIKHNHGGYFEYKVVPVKDLMGGSANTDKMEEVLNLYGEMGWRLSQVSVNTLGHSTFTEDAASTFGNIQEQTVLIFERWRMA